MCRGIWVEGKQKTHDNSQLQLNVAQLPSVIEYGLRGNCDCLWLLCFTTIIETLTKIYHNGKKMLARTDWYKINWATKWSNLWASLSKLILLHFNSILTQCTALSFISFMTLSTRPYSTSIPLINSVLNIKVIFLTMFSSLSISPRQCFQSVL